MFVGVGVLVGVMVGVFVGVSDGTGVSVGVAVGVLVGAVQQLPAFGESIHASLYSGFEQKFRPLFACTQISPA